IGSICTATVRLIWSGGLFAAVVRYGAHYRRNARPAAIRPRLELRVESDNNVSPSRRTVEMPKMNVTRSLAIASAVAAALAAVPSLTADAASRQVERGRYLVNLGGCSDCHTPGNLLGKPDATRFLGGSEVGFELPGAGTFYPPNLTPDKETGLGNWTTAQ